MILSLLNESMFNSIIEFLHSSSKIKNFKHIKRVHAQLLTTGQLFASLDIHTKLVLSYATFPNKNNHKTVINLLKCVNPKSPLPFNVTISAFCRNKHHFLALKVFSFMHFEGVDFDSFALCSSLTSSSHVKDVKFGRQMHGIVVKSGWLSSVFVGCALIDLYGRSLLMRDAEKVFDEIPVKNSACANALFSGFSEANMWVDGIELVRKMPFLKLDYDLVTLSSVLRACTSLSAIEMGRQVHAYFIRRVCGVENDAIFQSSLMEMYGKSGFVRKALQVFNSSGLELRRERKKDVVLWTTMLGIYGRNGHYKEVIELFKTMLREGIRPDGVAFLTIISACGRTGQVENGIDYFSSMIRDYKLDPDPEHYSCLVDLLCRAGKLDEAWKLVNQMLDKGHAYGSISMWGALLNACKNNLDIEMAKNVAQTALQLFPQSVGIYVILSHLYADLGLWDEIDQLRKLIKENGLTKEVGRSWI